MNIVYVVAALAICIIVLFYLQYKETQKSNALTGDIKKLYADTAEQLRKDIDARNEEFKKTVHEEVLARLEQAGVSKQQLDNLTSQTAEVQQTVQKLQSDVKDAALNHIQTLQTLVDSKMQFIHEQSDLALQDMISKAQAQQKSASDSWSAQVQSDQAQLQAQLDQSNKAFIAYQQQAQDLYAQQTKGAADQNTLFNQQMAKSAAGYQTQIASDAAALRAALKADSDTYKTQLSTLFDGIKAQLASSVTSYQQALQARSDAANKLFADTATTLTNQYILGIKTQGDTSQQLIKDAIAAFQTNEVPTLVSTFSKSLQDVIAKTQADMQKMLYGYGYRRSYTCSYSIADNSAQPTNLVGIQSIVRKVGTSITIHTCTLPAALPYDYVPIAQITENKAEAVTQSNDFAPLVTKAISSSSFSVAVERANGGMDVSIIVHLIEK